jgi:hypothetical protein
MGDAVYVHGAKIHEREYDGGVKTKLTLLGLLVATAMAQAAPPKKLPWMKAPGPIEGRWKVTCPGADGMIVAITVEEKKAVGRVEDPGAGTKYGYTKGEEILRLGADDFGDWVGQLEWRGISNVARWDPIRFTATPDVLDATMTTSECFRHMPRVK